MRRVFKYLPIFFLFGCNSAYQEKDFSAPVDPKGRWTATSPPMMINGRRCVEYFERVKIDDAFETVKGLRCQLPNGTWQVV